jgi:hypothetical protein
VERLVSDQQKMAVVVEAWTAFSHLDGKR